MTNHLKPGFAALRIRRLSALHARAHAAVHARDDHDLNWLCEREKVQRKQIGALALEVATMRERIVALEEAVARLEGHHPALSAEAPDLSGLAAWSSR